MTSLLSSRRSFLQQSAALAGLGLALRASFAAPATSDARFVFVILRGALDGLAAVPPYGDPGYARLRGTLAIEAPGTAQGGLRLDGTFALHPALDYLHQAYEARELIVLHAVATPYRERPHFDCQG